MSEENNPSWSEDLTGDLQHLPLENLLLEESGIEGKEISLSDARNGAEARQNALTKRIDELKSRAEMSVDETFRHMQVQKTISQHMQPTMLALFRIEIILDSIATKREAELTRQAVEDVLEKLEEEMGSAEAQLDHLISENIKSEDLKKNPITFTNPLKIKFKITCQQSYRMLKILSQLDRVLVKSSILDMLRITDSSSTKGAIRKWLGGVIAGMRSLINMERNVMRAQYAKREKDMEQVAKKMQFDKKATDRAKQANKEMGLNKTETDTAKKGSVTADEKKAETTKTDKKPNAEAETQELSATEGALSGETETKNEQAATAN